MVQSNISSSVPVTLNVVWQTHLRRNKPQRNCTRCYNLMLLRDHVVWVTFESPNLVPSTRDLGDILYDGWKSPSVWKPCNNLRSTVWHRCSAKHWIYPAGTQPREYQLELIQTALLQNTLVCLPTGLGKTLIAAVVMYNFSRWFPQVRLDSGLQLKTLAPGIWVKA